mmetsp:Transcript_70969/g.203390  ORF Transcript_70969/g.203390 Transcript_70969/m.203390 type:complete len:328 (-) Transcript_70969:253-1236(-)
MILQDSRGVQLLGFPQLVLRQFLLLPEFVAGGFVVGKIQLDASDLAESRVVGGVLLSLAHRIGRLGLILIVLATLASARLQVLACLLIYFADRQVQLGSSNADQLDQHLLVPLDPIGSSRDISCLLRDLGQVAQTLFFPFRSLDAEENTILHDAGDLASVDAVQLKRQGSLMVFLWLHLLFPALATSAPPPLLAGAAPSAALPTLLLGLLSQLLVVLFAFQHFFRHLGKLAFLTGSLDFEFCPIGSVFHTESRKHFFPLRQDLFLRQSWWATDLHQGLLVYRCSSALLGTAHLANELEEPLAERPCGSGAILGEFGLEVVDARCAFS